MIGELGKYLVRLKSRFPSKNLLLRYLAWYDLRLTLDQLNINCVLDVGANRGQFAQGLRRIGYKGWIISFEPSPGDFAVMQSQMRHDRKWQGHQMALGRENGELNFNVSLADSRLSSFLNMRNDAPTKVVSVKVQRLEAIFDEVIAPVPNPRVFLKMDTQGYDVEVIAGSDGCVGRCLGLLSEIAVDPAYEKMPRYIEALKIYKGLGFRLKSLSEIAWDRKDRTLAEMDCLMVR